MLGKRGDFCFRSGLVEEEAAHTRDFHLSCHKKERLNGGCFGLEALAELWNSIRRSRRLGVFRLRAPNVKVLVVGRRGHGDYSRVIVHH